MVVNTIIKCCITISEWCKNTFLLPRRMYVACFSCIAICVALEWTLYRVVFVLECMFFAMTIILDYTYCIAVCVCCLSTKCAVQYCVHTAARVCCRTTCSQSPASCTRLLHLRLLLASQSCCLLLSSRCTFTLHPSSCRRTHYCNLWTWIKSTYANSVCNYITCRANAL